MKFPIKIVYVAGPISGTPKEREANIEAGRKAGADVWRLGAVALVPHLNSNGMYEREGINGSDIYLGDLELLSRCDVLYVLPNWEKSRGTNYEVAWAKHKQIPTFYTLDALKSYLEEDLPF